MRNQPSPQATAIRHSGGVQLREWIREADRGNTEPLERWAQQWARYADMMARADEIGVDRGELDEALALI